MENLEQADGNLVVDYGFLSRHYAQAVGNLLLVRPRVLGGKNKEFSESKPRQYPVEFAGTSVQSDVFDISLPVGYQADEIPDPVEVSAPFAEYTSKFEIAGNVLRYTRLLTLNKCKYR